MTLLGYARTQARATIQEARAAVGNLRHREEGEHDLLSSMTTLAGNASQEFGALVLCRRQGRSWSVSESVAHELLMAVREAVYNAVLHGHPNQVEVKVEFTPRQLRIQVVDDGAGFDPGALVANSGTHYGILGMRERIEQLGGSLLLRSAPGEGTAVEMTLKRTSALVGRHAKVQL